MTTMMMTTMMMTIMTDEDDDDDDDDDDNNDDDDDTDVDCGDEENDGDKLMLSTTHVGVVFVESGSLFVCLFVCVFLQLVGAALLYTLEKGLGQKFTEEAKEAWKLLYGVVMDTMKAGARERNSETST